MNDDEDRGHIFTGGMSTDMDIRTLRERWPDTALTVGLVIPYADLEQVLKLKRQSARFRTVLSRWRRLIESETGTVVLGSERKVGLRVMDNTQKLDASHAKMRSAVRSARRSHQLVNRVDPGSLTAEERGRALALQQRSAAILGAAQVRRSAAALPDFTTTTTNRGTKP